MKIGTHPAKVHPEPFRVTLCLGRNWASIESQKHLATGSRDPTADRKTSTTGINPGAGQRGKRQRIPRIR
jgi:hypothetical protein